MGMVRNYMFDGYTKEVTKKQREKQQLDLRKKRREELISKRRNVQIIEDTSKISNLKNIKSLLLSRDLEDIKNGALEFRTLLSTENCPPIQSVVDSGVVPRLVELLSKSCC